MVRVFVLVCLVGFFFSCGTVPQESEEPVSSGAPSGAFSAEDTRPLLSLYRDAEVRLLRRAPQEVIQLFADIALERALTCWDWDGTAYYTEEDGSDKVKEQLAPGADISAMRFLSISLNRGSERYEGEEFVGYFLFYQNQLVSACVYRIANPELNRSFRNLVQEQAEPLIALETAEWARTGPLHDDAVRRLQDGYDPILFTGSEPSADGNVETYLMVPAPQDMPQYVIRSKPFYDLPPRVLSRWTLKSGSPDMIPFVIASPPWSHFDWTALFS